MDITKKYYTHPWLQELTTTVTSTHEREGQQLVVLQETIFYPTGGGQPHDLGSLNGEPLVDVFEQEGVIYHVLAQPLTSKKVECVLDWNRRFDHMQQHTGQHLLSAIFEDEFGYKTESFHLGIEYSSIDITASKLTIAEQEHVEKRVNQLIFSNLPISVYTMAPTELAEIPVRKLPQIEGDLRIVEIQGIDYSPCSGTHLESTGQLNLLKIIRTEKYKGMTRVYFLAGGRALADYAHKHQLSSELVVLLGVPHDELVFRVQSELEQKRELERKLQDLQGELVAFQAERIVADAEGLALFLDLPEATIEEAQHLTRAILNLGTYYVVINLGERLVLGHNLPTGLNLAQLIKEQGQPLGGRGGGSATNAQIYFAQPEALQRFYHFLQSNLEEIHKNNQF